ncbi:fibronectin type III domain-containing protein [Gilvibacter sp.]|uniref:fibronectin type III domain-containing protein n=1 Tax=Gilvibacter sp. TaxID=2729997 RepID=UPI003F4A50C8
MRYIFTFLVLTGLLTACSTDDDSTACDTEMPVEINQGEGRIAVSWQDFTEEQIIEAYEFGFVARGATAPENLGVTTNQVTVSSDPFNKFHIKTVESLPYDTEFDLYYRAKCDADSGEILGPIAVNSLAFGAGCTPPADFEVTEITTTTISIQWEGFDENLWRVSWGSADGISGGDVDVTETNYTITGLEPNTLYTIGVVTRCTTGDFSISELGLSPTENVTTLDE